MDARDGHTARRRGGGGGGARRELHARGPVDEHTHDDVDEAEGDEEHVGREEAGDEYRPRRGRLVGHELAHDDGPIVAARHLPQGEEAVEKGAKVLGALRLVVAEEAHRQDGVDAHEHEDNCECVDHGRQRAEERRHDAAHRGDALDQTEHPEGTQNLAWCPRKCATAHSSGKDGVLPHTAVPRMV